MMIVTQSRRGVWAFAIGSVVLSALAAGASAAGWEVAFRKIVIDKAFRSEGVAVADVNRDGRNDIMVGDLWYEAPDWKIHEIRPVGKFVAGKGYSNCFNCWAFDINRDGWVDQMVVPWPGKAGIWYENPKGKQGHWKARPFAPTHSSNARGVMPSPRRLPRRPIRSAPPRPRGSHRHPSGHGSFG